MYFTKLKKIITALCLILFTTSLYAVDEYVSKLYKDIDVVFVEKSDEKLNEILQNNKDDKNYFLIENYAEKKIRRLIVINDYQFAMDAIVVVIENNLDNEEAVEMYSTIAEAYAIQLEYEEKKQLERQAELARIEAEKDKQRVSADKEFNSSQTADGSAVYVSGKKTKSSNSSWDLHFGLIDLSVLNEVSSKYTALNDGVLASLEYAYNTNNINLGLDVVGDFRFLALGKENEIIPLLADLDFSPKISFSKLSEKMFIRAGLSIMNTTKVSSNEKTASVLGNLVSPTVGIGFDALNLGDLQFTFNCDYLLATLYTDGVKAGAQAFADLSIPFAQMETLNLKFHVGLKEKFFVKSNGFENRASIIFAIGAENVNK